MVQFTIFSKHEETFSRFRSDLVSCIKAVACLSLKTTELQGLRVNICGDSCEIGGVKVTRLACRLLDADISVQSPLSVFCFAGKSTLVYILCILFTLGKKTIRIISVGIAYMLYIVIMVNVICYLTKLGTLAPRSTLSLN